MEKRTVAHVQRPHTHPHPHSAMFYRPENSYFYFPKKEEEQLKDKRYVYYGQVEFTEKEKKYLTEYKKFLAAKKLTHSDYVTDQKIVLFLHEKEFKVEAAYKALNEHEQWRKANLPIQLTPQIQQLLESGIIYMSGRDNRYRPIVVMNLKLFDEKRTEIIIRTFSYFFEEIIDHVLLPGQVEQWVTIMDVEGFSLFSLPLGGGKKLLNHLETHYRGRLYKLYLVNSPSAVWLSWKIVKQFLEDSTVDKVDIVSDNKIKKLYKHANLSQIEKKFGGTQQNRTVFWPGNRPIEDFLTVEDSHEKLHLTKEEYKTKNLTNNIGHPMLFEPIVEKVQPVVEPTVVPVAKVEVAKLQQKVVEEKVVSPPPKVVAEEVPKPVQEVPKPVQEVPKPAQEVPKAPVPEPVVEVKEVPKPPAQKLPDTEVLIVEAPASLPPVKDIEHDREDKVDIEAETKTETPEVKHTEPAVEHKELKTHAVVVEPAHTDNPPAVAPEPPKQPIAHEPHTQAPPAPTQPQDSKAVVIPPPEPLPPVTVIDVKADKIHGQGSHAGTAKEQ